MFHKLKGFVLNIDIPLFKEVMLLAFPVIISMNRKSHLKIFLLNVKQYVIFG